MHEVSIVEGILENLNRQRNEHGLSKVMTIEITCGQYNCADEETLQFCYDTAVKGTWLSSARITIRRLAEQYRCRRCGNEFFLEDGQETCQCGSSEIVPQLNSDLYLSKLEVE